MQRPFACELGVQPADSFGLPRQFLVGQKIALIAERDPHVLEVLGQSFVMQVHAQLDRVGLAA